MSCVIYGVNCLILYFKLRYEQYMRAQRDNKKNHSIPLVGMGIVHFIYLKYILFLRHFSAPVWYPENPESVFRDMLIDFRSIYVYWNRSTAFWENSSFFILSHPHNRFPSSIKIIFIWILFLIWTPTSVFSVLLIAFLLEFPLPRKLFSSTTSYSIV